MAGREARRLGIPPGKFFDLCFYIILAALVGSRLLYVLLELRTFIAHPLKIFALWEGGLVFQGGVILAFLVASFTSAATACPGAPPWTPWGWGRPWGNFSGASAVLWPGVAGALLPTCPGRWSLATPTTLCPLREPLHPAQLYEAALALGVFGFLYWFRTRKRFDGQVILMYFCLAGLVRFIVEFFRSPLDYRGHVFFGWMPLTQLIALLLFLVCGGLLLFWSFRARPRTQGSDKVLGFRFWV